MNELNSLYAASQKNSEKDERNDRPDHNSWKCKQIENRNHSNIFDICVMEMTN